MENQSLLRRLIARPEFGPFVLLVAELAVFTVSRYGDEITAVITHTVDRWDGKEAADRIELENVEVIQEPRSGLSRSALGRSADPLDPSVVCRSSSPSAAPNTVYCRVPLTALAVGFSSSAVASRLAGAWGPSGRRTPGTWVMMCGFLRLMARVFSIVTLSQMPVLRSRMPGIQSHPSVATMPGVPSTACVSLLF